jgi:hypothetical protein
MHTEFCNPAHDFFVLFVEDADEDCVDAAGDGFAGGLAGAAGFFFK